jgi:F0F1-type ATP synthase assembly protein I
MKHRLAAPATRPQVQRFARGDSLFFMGDEHRDKTPQTAAVLWARYSQIAFIIPAAVVVGLLVGKLLDYWFHTHWLFLAGVIVGAIAGFVDLIRTVTHDKGLRSD